GRWCGRSARPHHRHATHSHERGVGGFWSGLGVYSTPSRFLSRNSCQLPSSIILLMASVIAWHLSEPGGIPTPYGSSENGLPTSSSSPPPSAEARPARMMSSVVTASTLPLSRNWMHSE